ncbi:MAG TPA: cytochrome ubiquinol oxidase subunit I, partial [Candidatus Acidoferrum sp.]|nr:cytochrome ubiquinol oxidase subunit I [Candidatus Acidoferrum sp.]
LANAWMNGPRGFRLEAGKLADIDVLAAMASPFALHEVLHTILAAFMATALAVAAIHAWALLRRAGAPLHRAALGLALVVAIPSALAQPLVGHMAGQVVARHQPLKLAAMEQLARTTRGAPMHLGPIEIPGALSPLATLGFSHTEIHIPRGSSSETTASSRSVIRRGSPRAGPTREHEQELLAK